MTGRGLYEVSAGASPSRRCSIACCWVQSTRCGASCGCRTPCRTPSRSCARRCSARCSTPRATTLRATARTSRSSSRGRSIARSTPAPTAPRAPTPRRAQSEHHALGALLTGALAPRSWRGDPPRADFFAAKALLAALLDRFHVGWSVLEQRWPFLHPGRSAAVLAQAQTGETVRLGFVGEVHPTVAQAWDLERTAAFAVDLGKLAEVAPEVVPFRAFGAFPTLRQDIAVTVPDAVPARQVLEALRDAAGDTLDAAEIFDVYTGAQVGAGASLAGRRARVPHGGPHADRRGRRARARADRRRAGAARG